MSRRISFSQNGEDIRLWHAFGPRESGLVPHLTYVEVGANLPWHFSISASLYTLGWRGLLVEADPDLARELRLARPDDVVVHAAATSTTGTSTFFQVPGTGLGSLDSIEADSARARSYEVVPIEVPCRPIDDILAQFLAETHFSDIHALSIDVEGAEADVIAGLRLKEFRPWVLCIEAIDPGTQASSHRQWEESILARGYRYVAFDGINRWYVANEHADRHVSDLAGAPGNFTIAEAISLPFNVLDSGRYGWITEESARLWFRDNRAYNRAAWQRELILSDITTEVDQIKYERHISELRQALAQVEGSRTFALSRRLSKGAKKGIKFVHHLRGLMPDFAVARLTRERHLRHVSSAMNVLTDPAYLGSPLNESVTWNAPELERPPVPPGLELDDLQDGDVDAIEAWISRYPHDSDEQLESRMDNLNDEVGRVRAALRTRVALGKPSASVSEAGGDRVLFDARSLQAAEFGNRGIGRFARAALDAVRATVGDDHVTLLVDPGLRPLDDALLGRCSCVTRITESDVPDFGVLIEPSPMTHTADPLIPLLRSSVYSVALVFDFIPMHYPTVYLRGAAPRAEYAACLDALKLYKDFLCISHVTERELLKVLGEDRSQRLRMKPTVAWPRALLGKDRHAPGRREVRSGPIVLMTGDEPRKNTFGGLAGIAAATCNDDSRDVVVLGMAGQGERVHHWSIAAAMRPGEARTAGRISDTELSELLQESACVVVPSFDEGLSLPVIEAVNAGTPVVASDIPAHRELIGSGVFAHDPRDPRSIERSVRRVLRKGGVATRQKHRLLAHRHEELESAISGRVRDHVGPPRAHGDSPKALRERHRTLSVGVATPWVPQRTGVADFSTAVFTELARHADVTVYTTAGGGGSVPLEGGSRLSFRNVDAVFANPAEVLEQHDFFITVVGNSHFHLPFVQLLLYVDSIVVAHDTRMVEFYMALRGMHGAEHMMLMTRNSDAPLLIDPPLNEQIDDMRLLQNAGLWEVANRATELIMHSPSAKERIERETGIGVQVLPFANQRVPEDDADLGDMRVRARARLGLDSHGPGVIHLGSFGYVDPRTKMTDVIVEAAGWLSSWGHRVALHLVGEASEQVREELYARTHELDLVHFNITGFQTESNFRDWLVAVDVGVQLRVSPLLGVSGPLSDLAAFGTPAVATTGLCVDVGTPGYILRLGDAVSPVTVAEGIEEVLKRPLTSDEREDMRRAYLVRKTAEGYAQALRNIVEMRE